MRGGRREVMKEFKGKVRVEGTRQATFFFVRRKRNISFLLIEVLVTELLINYKSCILYQAIEGLCTD